MSKQHHYQAKIIWTGNTGIGTKSYTEYERSYSVLIDHKIELQCSSDTPFRGDATKHNPEDFLLASLSSCHMLWYLHLCADAGIIVVDYTDNATGILSQNDNGIGCFTEVILHPIVTITEDSMKAKAIELHQQANKMCFMANSVNFKVKHEPICKIKE